MSLIVLDNVEKKFADTGEVIRPLSLQISNGQFVSILGPSGCGKSTLLRLIAGLESVDGGRITCGSQPKISFVFQDALLLPWRTALENVRLPLEIESRDRRGRHIDEKSQQMLKRVGLEESSGKLPHQLSGGMKMRVSLARALVTEPDILLLDEPFGSLDEVTRFRLQEDLRQIWNESRMTVIFVTHSLSEAAFLAERQIVLSNRPAHVLADRVSPLTDERDDRLRVSREFADEVAALQILFRSSAFERSKGAR